MRALFITTNGGRPANRTHAYSVELSTFDRDADRDATVPSPVLASPTALAPRTALAGIRQRFRR